MAKIKLQELETAAMQQCVGEDLVSPPPASSRPCDHELLIARLRAIHPDELNPKQALELLYQLKSEL